MRHHLVIYCFRCRHCEFSSLVAYLSRPASQEAGGMPRSGFRLCLALSGGLLRVGDDVDPLLVGRALGVVVVVPVPPLVRRSLRVSVGRILPTLLASERGQIEIAPCTAHCFVTAVVDE